MTDLVPVGRTKFQERWAQYQIARGVASQLHAHWQRWNTQRKSASLFYVTIEEDDELYDELAKWFMRTLRIDEQRSVIAETGSVVNRDPATSRYSRINELVLYSDIETSTTVVISGYEVKVEITSGKPGKPATDHSDSFAGLFGEVSDEPASSKPGATLASITAKKNIVFTCTSREERHAVVQHLAGMVESTNVKEDRTPSFYSASGFSGFRSQSHIMRRPLNSVILSDDGIDRVSADIEKFINDEERYISMGLPWHRGYLFHGPPGTGKTSLATAIANQFKLDVYYIPLSMIESDNVLMNLVSEVSSNRAVMVMEDIDIVRATRDRDTSDTPAIKGVTLGGLLQALDGIATPHGLISIMTTNRVEDLDPALIRPGRVDFRLEISYVTDEQLDRICQRFGGRKFDLPSLKSNITPAEVVGFFKDYDTDGAEEKIAEFISQRNGE